MSSIRTRWAALGAAVAVTLLIPGGTSARNDARMDVKGFVGAVGPRWWTRQR